MRLHTIQANVPADLVGGHEVSIEDCPAGLVWQTQQPLLVPNLTEETPMAKGYWPYEGRQDAVVLFRASDHGERTVGCHGILESGERSL